MDSIVLTGAADAVQSFELARRLDTITSQLRPSITVDLSAVDELHPSIVSVLIRHRRQARRLGGDVRLVVPIDPSARQTIEHIGLIGGAR